ncbi:MAG: CpsD/CapB family tyrosine-protein kinase [Pseudohongiella sp.]|nr:CpsD/CapB family tyrosine-protein kinase [Pseudohongiella sp.]MDO9518769.1 CpsD/CapB family tyrosine-protein kinase [Pseudohongiella sp.]MDP2128934.1 CpsD/CapB family tyrosine-protein kinase [Pseudohongiella sp.]
MFEISEKRALDPKLVNLLKPNSTYAESYQRLRLSVESSRNRDEGVVVAIASPVKGEGKTLTAINLAAALAQNPAHKVLLIDLNLRPTQNSIKEYLGIQKWRAPGVVENVLGKAIDWDQLAQTMPALNLHFMPSGQQAQSPYEILNSGKMGEMVAEARRRYDFVILDTAAVTLFADTQLISPLVDKFVVLVAAGETSKKQLGDCLNLMPPDKVMGLVINSSKKTGGGDYAV